MKDDPKAFNVEMNSSTSPFIADVLENPEKDEERPSCIRKQAKKDDLKTFKEKERKNKESQREKAIRMIQRHSKKMKEKIRKVKEKKQ